MYVKVMLTKIVLYRNVCNATQCFTPKFGVPDWTLVQCFTPHTLY